jgi:ABC-type polysaccharide/polyol phosphate transport system ATPase subunit
MSTSAVTVARAGKRYLVHTVRHDTLRHSLAAGSTLGSRTALWAVRGITFTARAGESIAMLGANGSGKSTLLRLIAGIERPTTGTIETTGGVVSVLGLGVGFSQHLSGSENIEVASGLLGASPRKARATRDQVVEFSGLGEFIDQPVREYSSGMLARLGFALAVHTPADVFLIDEVLAVGDEEFQERCLDRLEQLRSGGATLLFATHDRSLVDRLADRQLQLRNGFLAKDEPLVA